jgi:metallo-beta-lactamase family protein
VKIFGDTYKLRAEVVTLNAFSAHADYNEILDSISTLNKDRLKHIFLVHGEPDAQSHLQGLLDEKGYSSTIVKYNDKYQLEL